MRRANAALDASADGAAPHAATALHLLEVLGIKAGGEGPETATVDGLTDVEVEALLDERATARAARDFSTADRIRDELAASGIVVSDSADGATWHRG